MQAYKLNLKSRQPGKRAAAEVERNNAIGVVYGHGVEDSVPVEGDWQTVYSLLRDAGTSHIIQLVIDDQPMRQVLLKAIDFDPVSNQMRHFDLYAVKADEKITAEVPIIVTGDSPAARIGLLVHQLLDEIEVSTLPASLPESFEVDISTLEEVGDTIYVSDLNLPEGVEVEEEMKEQPIIKVDAPREEEPEPETEAEPADAADVPSEHGAEEADSADEKPADES